MRMGTKAQLLAGSFKSRAPGEDSAESKSRVPEDGSVDSDGEPVSASSPISKRSAP